MKNILIGILIIGALVLLFLFLKEKDKAAEPTYIPDTEQTTPTNNQQSNTDSNNPVSQPIPTANNRVCDSTTKPWVKVISPNGGEVYQNDQQITVKWETCNNPYNPKKVGVSIFDVNGSYTYYLSGNHSDSVGTSDTGSLSATLPPFNHVSVNNGSPVTFPTGNNFKLRVFIYPMEYDSYEDSSDTTFTINSPGNPQEWGDGVNGQHMGYVKNISGSEGNYSLKIDYVILNNCPPVNPGDECITNNNPLLRTFPISNNVIVKSLDSNHQVINSTLQQFVSSFSSETFYSLNWIRLENGKIVEIRAQYLP